MLRSGLPPDRPDQVFADQYWPHAPKTGKTVRLKFLSHRQGVGLGLALALFGLVDLFTDAHQCLYMVPDLMGDDIGLCEIPRGIMPVFQILEERKIRRRAPRNGPASRESVAATGKVHGKPWVKARYAALELHLEDQVAN